MVLILLLNSSVLTRIDALFFYLNVEMPQSHHNHTTAFFIPVYVKH
nr:MAG TPA: hypothetical protein [Caudoviricetes sp.]